MENTAGNFNQMWRHLGIALLNKMINKVSKDKKENSDEAATIN